MQPELKYRVRLIRPRSPRVFDGWAWRLAYTDGRHNLRRLLLFAASVMVGVAALVAIDSFSRVLQDEIDRQARELLGADMVVRSSGPPDSLFLSRVREVGGRQSTDVHFASMALFLTVRNGTRLVQVVAKEPGFPFYGEVEAFPPGVLEALHDGPYLALDDNLAVQYEVSSGDSVKLGQTVFRVLGVIRAMPGRNIVSATFTPSVYISRQQLAATGLIRFGSRTSYRHYIGLADTANTRQAVAKVRALTEEYGYSLTTVEDQKRSLGRAFDDLYRFFHLLAFVALILGCLGVASSIRIYLQQKRQAVAVLRCLGASGWQAFRVYFVQSLFLGMAGSMAGILLGMLIQYLLPLALAGTLPLAVSFTVVWSSLAKGLVVGVAIALVFSLGPLLQVRQVPPLGVLRQAAGRQRLPAGERLLAAVLMGAVPGLLAVWQTGNWRVAVAFLAGLLVVFSLLYLLARGVMRVLRWLAAGSGISFVLKQGMSNLYRPQNQTTLLITVIGLGAFLLVTLAQVREGLLARVSFMARDSRPNTVLFDIQPYQRKEVVAFTREHELPVLQLVPIVTTRLQKLKGQPVDSLKAEAASRIPRWALIREYRVTYRDSLIDSETLLSGSLRPYRGQEDSVFVSISEGMAGNLQLGPGDEVVFDVQGVPITTYIGSVRKVDWQRIQTNFSFVFPSGVIDRAPQFYVLMTRSPDPARASVFQQQLVRFFPNVSVIDLRLILQTLDGFTEKIAFIIRFMAFFSLATGLLVLSGAIGNSRYVRLRENVLLRTLGARHKQIVRLTLVEYALLGLLAGIAGTMLALAAAGLLARMFFKMEFVADYYSAVTVCLAVALLTTAIGWLNSRAVFGDTPMEVLRKENV